MWGATFDNLLDATGYPISIHAPRVGRDTTVLLFDEFQSISIHAPRVGRDDIMISSAAFIMEISIHAPRVGRDENGNSVSAVLKKFQSTRPVWGATYHDRPE